MWYFVFVKISQDVSIMSIYENIAYYYINKIKTPSLRLSVMDRCFILFSGSYITSLLQAFSLQMLFPLLFELFILR